ncbi:MAG: hypothetical protein KDE50_08305, partial [Caldilineaceae bacterium]|nr:hypothetical protein [Caldilineaceae bacterium]
EQKTYGINSVVALKTQDEAGEAFGIYIDHTTYLRFVKVGQAIKLTPLTQHSGSLLTKGISHVELSVYVTCHIYNNLSSVY